ncbi:helix-turn-helix domain-containing protein [Streptococcus suis]|uniref:helix-turn-helix domain-containing protein n=1 Tax=Streptococcus suis TaxID=1307 RepID=UPI001885E244|nr:helix-turn-helix domain-containing protein [Streptococcus suis]HEM4704298.1 helix-turn-helix domain-containing protein [Streptococcus suis]
MLEAFEALKQEIIQEVLSEVRKELADVKPSTKTSDESIGVKEACQIMGMSRNTFMVLVNTGKIPYHMVGTHYRFDKRDVKYCKSKMKIEKKVKGIAL